MHSRSKKTFKALIAEKSGDTYIQSVKERTISDLPDHDVLVKVHYSSLNYKEALSATGNKGVTKEYPFTPGIDAAGVVEESSDDRFKDGDEVIVTSYDLGMNTPGGFGQYISVPGDWIVPLPAGLSIKESMMIGTSGLTAAIGVEKIIKQQIGPADGKVLVTGATGGVGSFAVGLLSQLGYQVIAATGKMDQTDFLNSFIIETINEQMKATGYTLDRDNPDLLVLISITTDLKTKRQEEPVYASYPYNNSVAGMPVSPFYQPFYYRGWYDWYYPGGVIGYTTDTYSYKKGTVVVDLVDRETKQSVWKGITSEPIMDQSETEAVQESIRDIFQEYPLNNK